MSVFNFYVDTSTIDDRNKAEIILDTPIQTQPNEYLEVKVIDVSMMNDNYNISSSLNNNQFIIKRTQIGNIPTEDTPIAGSPLFNALDFYQNNTGNSLASGVIRGHYDGYETLENGTITIYYHNTDVVAGSNTHYIHNVFDNQDLSQDVTLSSPSSKDTYWVFEDVLETGYMFHEVDITLEHNGNLIGNTTTFTFKIAYSSDNVTFTDYQTTTPTIVFPQTALTTIPYTKSGTITASNNTAGRLYKYYKIYFETDVAIPDGEYTFVKVRPKKKDFTLVDTSGVFNETITIPDGFYNSTNFITTLNTLLLSYNLLLSINSTTNKLLIQNNNIPFTPSVFVPVDANNNLVFVFDNNLLKRLFGITADETTFPKDTITTADNPLNLLHYQKLVLTTDLTFNVPTTHLLKEWKEDKADGMRNILLWLPVDEPPYTIIKYKNYEGLSYRINDSYIKNLNFYFYNEFKQSVDINRLLFHIQIIKKNISYY